jgi:hypothetical protein
MLNSHGFAAQVDVPTTTGIAAAGAASGSGSGVVVAELGRPSASAGISDSSSSSESQILNSDDEGGGLELPIGWVPPVTIDGRRVTFEDYSTTQRNYRRLNMTCKFHKACARRHNFGPRSFKAGDPDAAAAYLYLWHKAGASCRTKALHKKFEPTIRSLSKCIANIKAAGYPSVA